MKILITGCKGQLGSDVVSVLAPEHVILANDLPEFDIGDFDNVNSTVNNFKPDLVVNCAAYTHVDKCETNEDNARIANVAGPENIARSLKKYGGRLIHISTDYVFDGKKKLPLPYFEEDEPSPLSVYGKSKLDGEQAIINSTERYAILRTAWLYGANGNNFLKTMMRLALKMPEKTVRVVNDQYGSPTWSFRLARQIGALIGKECNGIFHATSEGCCTWYQFAKYFLEKMDIPHNLVPCKTEEYPTPTHRPTNSILENARLKAEGIHLMVDWKEDLDAFVHLNRETLIEEIKGENKK